MQEVLLIPVHGESLETEYFSGLGFFDGYIDVHVDLANDEQMKELKECGKRIYCISENGGLVICDGIIAKYGGVFLL